MIIFGEEIETECKQCVSERGIPYEEIELSVLHLDGYYCINVRVYPVTTSIKIDATACIAGGGDDRDNPEWVWFYRTTTWLYWADPSAAIEKAIKIREFSTGSELLI